ncbi:MAG: thioredoxin family protein, partial [Alphaproteobacteria bacterium]|nr:thioredoxin family protein [Alphaproteobacteria bacterium]
AAVDWRWPAPSRFSLFGLETFGYRGEVLFPLTVHPQRTGEPVSLRAKLELLVCSKICVPRTLALALDLSAGAATADPDGANRIARGEARVPDDDGARSGLSVPQVTVTGSDPATLRVRVSSRDVLANPDVIVETPRWTFGPPDWHVAPDRRSAVATLPVTSGPDAATMPGAHVVLTLTDGPRAAEIKTAVVRGAVSARPWLLTLMPFLGIALLGGFILNLMPCVLPVLSLKLLAVLRHQGAPQRHIRAGFVASAAGVIVSMLAIGALLAGLKAAGAVVGFGIQFQQPAFLTFLAGVLIVFAANLAGVFELTLPPRLATALGGSGGTGIAGSFLAGAFATLLATPCSAPFVGTAIAFALARGPADILAVFGTLGLGLAAPHLVVAAVPAVTRALPRPGRWMAVVRACLAAALAGTAVWLLSVLAAQTSTAAAIATGAAFLVLALLPRLRLRLRLGATAAGGLAGLVLAGVVALLVLSRTTPIHAGTTAWRPFDAEAIRRLVAEGDVVFVDVTADWCVTCQANRVLVIDSPEVGRLLGAPRTVAMLADWTRPDPQISDYLARNGRYGIPFNAVYGPGAPRGIVLSELLTRQALLDALRRARNDSQFSSR